jgi:RNA polymerase sigma-70 factor (subfamily 1)
MDEAQTTVKPDPPGARPENLAQLLSDAARGDRAALDRLLAACEPYLRVLAVARYPARLRPRADPSDLVQETLARAAVRLKQFRGRTPDEWLAWLRQLLDTRAADLARHHRAARRSAERDVAYPTDSAGAAAAPGPSPSTCAARAEDAGRLDAWLSALPSADRDLVLWRYRDRLGYAEIPRRLGVSPDAARKRCGRALDALRRLAAGGPGASP